MPDKMTDQHTPEGNTDYTTTERTQGHETDALVAERVMGWVRDPNSSWWLDGSGAMIDRVHAPDANNYMPCFSPSSDIVSAWRVVERLRGLGFNVDIHSNAIDGWWCRVSVKEGHPVLAKYWQSDIELPAPLAICSAALQATCPT